MEALNNNIFRIERRVLMRDIAYEKLKDAIREGAFKPHTRLVEEKIASIIGTSRTPVREVFQKLEKDGLIYKRPRGGYAVAENFDVNSEEYIEFSIGLIGYGVYLTAMKIKDDGIKTVEDIIKEEEKSAGLNDLNAFYLNNLRFYKTICGYAGNKVLFNMSKTLSVENFTFSRTGDDLSALIKKRIDIHEQIVSYMKKRNPHMAEKMARKDLAVTLNKGLWFLHNFNKIK